MPHRSVGEELFPNVQPESLLVRLEAIPSSPIDSHINTTSLQVVAESSKTSPEPPLLQTKQSQLPQLFFIRLVLQTPHQFCCPSLDMFQGLNVLLVVRGPKLNTILEVC